ncbi:MAG TPA: GDP-mannose 4,6-dehydratase [Vicinamibacterales bacterium]|nr:GDP-mannose 4,6-dehydratase [Vicinamibacterales bacterium]
MSRTLITGATGFAGRHLLKELLGREQPVSAWSHAGGRRRVTPAEDPRIAWRAVDLLDAAAVRDALAADPPSVIFHCAGVANVHTAWTAPEQSLRVNALGTHHLLDAARRSGFTGRIVVVSSALVYRPSSAPIGEDHPIGPDTPYGVSKVAQEMLATASGLDVVIARPFNHAGPGQDPGFVTSAFARQVAEIEAGLVPPVLRVGNLDARRDLTDVRDTVRAYRMLADAGRSGRPYNVCSGTAYRVRDLLDVLLSLAGVPVRVETDPARLRPSDNPLVLGSRARITEETGWMPEIAIDRTLSDLLRDWRRRVAAGQAPAE